MSRTLGPVGSGHGSIKASTKPCSSMHLLILVLDPYLADTEFTTSFSCPCGLPQYYNAPIKTAAQAVGLSLSCFKKVCRKLGVPRWPARKLRCLGKLRDTVLQQDDLPQDVKEVRGEDFIECIPVDYMVARFVVVGRPAAGVKEVLRGAEAATGPGSP